MGIDTPFGEDKNKGRCRSMAIFKVYLIELIMGFYFRKFIKLSVLVMVGLYIFGCL